jgi:glycosyltransferase involved in cell wall biosynthesis
VGAGRYRGDVEQMFADSRNVHFIGAVESARVASLMAEADVFAWPGLGEAYGLVFLEAQAMGLPIIACRDRGVPDATFEGRTTVLSAAGDAAAFAANVRRLAGDSDLRASFGAAGREFVASERNVAAAARTLKLALSELRR